MLFATLATVVFSGLVANMKVGDPKDALTATSITLQMNAMTLTVGWSWMSVFTTFIAWATDGMNNFVKLSTFLVLLIAIWIYTAVFYHWGLAVRRGSDRARKKRLQQA